MMGEKSKDVIGGLAKQLPAAVLVFLAFTASNYHWGQRLDEACRVQTQYSQRLTEAIEKLAAEVVQVHAHLDARAVGGN
jgi:hypothetical protein